MTGHSSLLDRFRRPEYTGGNRCIPCTIVNVAIALVVAGGVAVFNPLVGAGVLTASLLAIYLRGYLVPGTPTLTKRYFPDWLLAKFDKADLEVENAAEPTLNDADVETDPETVLLENDLVGPCEDVEDLCLAADVREEWRGRMDDLRDGDREAQLADVLGIEPDELGLEGSEHVTARAGPRRVGRWESEAALLADLAAHGVLASRVPAWEAVPIGARGAIAAGLRAFAETCPTCGGPLSITEDTVESCCRSYEVHAIACEDCEAKVLEVTQ